MAGSLTSLLTPADALVGNGIETAVKAKHRVLLAELAERVDVRVLVWAGAPIPAFHPTRSQIRENIENLVRDTRSAASPIRASTRFTATTRRPS
jgi:hypothetical protein